MQRASLLALVWIALNCLGLGGVAHAANYTVTDLGALPVGATTDFGAALNGAGDVAGSTSTAAFTLQAFGWTAGGGFDQLGTLGGAGSIANGINDAGVIVGRSDNGVGLQTRPFRVLPSGMLQSLGTLGGNFGSATAINAAGAITGVAANATTSRAFIWTEGAGMIDIGNFTPSGFSTGLAINTAGHIAGQGTTAGSELHAFWWNGVVMQDLGTLPMGVSSLAQGMNDADQVVGLSTKDPLGTSYHAFLWEQGAGMVELDELGPYDTRAFDVNNDGDVVGWSWIDNSGNARAVLWENGGAIVDLNTSIPAGSGWLLNDARAINDAGQIVGNGVFNGSPRAFLLTPVPEPGSALLMVCSFAVAMLHFAATKRCTGV